MSPIHSPQHRFLGRLRRTLQQLERELAAERARRQQAEARLASFTLRASENNSALARNNLRLQEQLARLRGESDLLSHEAGCQRAAAAAREQEAAHKLALLQQRLHAAEDEQRVLRRQLAGKQVMGATDFGRCAVLYSLKINLAGRRRSKSFALCPHRRSSATLKASWLRDRARCGRCRLQ